jgi:hypothetical protein
VNAHDTPEPTLARAKAVVDAAAESARRDPALIGFEGRISVLTKAQTDHVPREVEKWRQLDATHLSIDTRRFGLRDGEHVNRIRRVAKALGLG